MTWLTFQILLFIFSICRGLDRQSLGGEDWFFKDAEGEYQDLKATVPGGIYTDLLRNKIIDEPLFGDNDYATKWVPRTNWTYYSSFDVDNDLLVHENINMVLEGLDTFASVWLNDVRIGESKNMFVQYVFDVKNHLKLGTNKIEVQFLSPVEVSLKLATEQSEKYEVPPQCSADEFRGECHVNEIRKMPASFSWDWGPSFPSVGIWKDIYLEAFNSSVIRYVMTRAEESSINPAYWNVSATIYLANNKQGNVKGQIALQLYTEDSVDEKFDIDLKPNEFGEIVTTLNHLVPKSLANLWWPNGYGEQHTYRFSVQYSAVDDLERDTKTRTIGFRTIELIQDKLENGRTFYFKVNGIPIFAKGSNLIPIDIIPERGMDEAKILSILETVKEGHMNMIRVWGGGIYQSDYLYETADKLGIMIWQDFMFACALYPTDDEYLSNVRDEINHQFKRLNGHPSIAIWAGNNENEVALTENWYQTADNFELYKKDYITLYYGTIKKEVSRLDDQVIYLGSSPTNGIESDENGGVANDPWSNFSGDVHFYSYSADSFDTLIYPVTRFASEYGYQSLPSIEAWLTATNSTKNLDIDGEFLDHRQHHPGGNHENEDLIGIQLTLPPKNSSNYFKALVYYSQIVQAMSIKIETESYRKQRSILDSAGQGLTMGALYWQLNDVWVAPTWSGVDYFGKWKILQYFVKDFFSPIIVTGYLNAERDLEVYVVSDKLVDIPNATLSIYVYKWDSFEPVSTPEKIVLDIKNSASSLVTTLEADNILTESGCGENDEAKNNCFFYLVLENKSELIAPNNFVLPTKIKYSNLIKPTIQVTDLTQIDNNGNEFEITLKSSHPALFVWLDTHSIPGRFSQNGFLQVTETQKVYFTSDQATSTDQLSKVLTISDVLNFDNF